MHSDVNSEYVSPTLIPQVCCTHGCGKRFKITIPTVSVSRKLSVGDDGIVARDPACMKLDERGQPEVLCAVGLETCESMYAPCLQACCQDREEAVPGRLSGGPFCAESTA